MTAPLKVEDTETLLPSLTELRAEAHALTRGYKRAIIGRLLPGLHPDSLLDPFADVLVSRDDAVANTRMLISRLEALAVVPLSLLAMEYKVLALQLATLAVLRGDRCIGAVA